MTITINPLLFVVIMFIIVTLALAHVALRRIQADERMRATDNAHYERMNDSYQSHAERMEILRNPQSIYLFSEHERMLIRHEMSHGLTLFDAVALLHDQRRVELPQLPAPRR